MSFATLDTSSTPMFLGINSRGRPLGAGRGKGEDVIVGIVDGGIWPEHPSVSTAQPRTATRPRVASSATSRSQDGTASAFRASIQRITTATRSSSGRVISTPVSVETPASTLNQPWEFNSPRDFGGHGTHTATTAAGNESVPASGEAVTFGNISGIAPRARIAVYKVCWQQAPGGSGSCCKPLTALPLSTRRLQMAWM